MSNPLNNYMNVEDKITAPGNTGAAGSNPVLDALNKNYALQTASLDKKYTAAQAELEASRLRGKKEASVNNTKLMKYLPSILKRQGLSGLGVSQTATISANNNFRKSLTDIEAAHSKSSAELLGNYADAKLAYDTEYNTKAAELLQKAIDDKNAEEKTEMDANFKNAWSIISSDTESLDFTALLETYKGKVSDADYQTLVNLAASQVTANKAAKTDKETEKTETEMDANFKNAWSIISSDTESLDFTALLETYKGKVSDADYQTLVNLAASQVAANTAAKTDKETEKADKAGDEARAEALMLVDILSQSEKYDEGLKYLETVKDILGDDIYGIYKGYFESELGKNDEEVDDKDVNVVPPGAPIINQTGHGYENMTQDEKNDRVTSGKDIISYQGQNYRIKTDNKGNPKMLKAKANEIEHNRDFDKQIYDLGYNSAYDKNIPNGLTLTIKCDATGANEVNWEDFIGGGGIIDVTDWQNYIPGYNIYTQLSRWFNWETRTITFYDGEWYYSETTGKSRDQSNTDATTSVPAASLDVYKQYTGGGAIGGSNIPTRK